MKPVAILLALASTACTVSAGLPRFARLQHASERLRTGTNYLKIAYAMVLQWTLRVRMTGNATPTIAREEDAMTAVILAT
ncbi:hypothetical protein ACJA88_010031 [Fusarium oxysporum]